MNIKFQLDKSRLQPTVQIQILKFHTKTTYNLDILNDDEQTSQNNSNVLNEDNEVSLLNENNETNHTEECMSDFIEAISSDDVTQTELATAYIAAFFNGRTTQTSLSDFIKLSNIT